MPKGKFIILDGIDGSGKTTQLALLKEWLEKEEGKQIISFDFPQYSEFWGKMAGRFLSGEFGGIDEVSPYLVSPLYFLDQASCASKITAALNEGKWVLSNRYLSSSLIHQTARIKDDSAKLEFRNWLMDAAYNVAGLYREDLVIALKVSPEISIIKAKEAKARKSYAKVDIAEENFDHLLSSSLELNYCATNLPNWEVVNCMSENATLLSVIEVQEKIRSIIRTKYF